MSKGSLVGDAMNGKVTTLMENIYSPSQLEEFLYNSELNTAVEHIRDFLCQWLPDL